MVMLPQTLPNNIKKKAVPISSLYFLNLRSIRSCNDTVLFDFHQRQTNSTQNSYRAGPLARFCTD